MRVNVSIVPCPDYGDESVRIALRDALAPLGGLDWVTPGMRIAVKANLVARMKPEDAATTHPALVTELCRMLTARGAVVTVGDSPSGPFSAAWVNGVYAGTGMKAVESAGAVLNRDFSVTEADFPTGHAVRQFPFTAWLGNADAVIDFAKLKTHALTGMTAGVKNFFGVIPGTRKPEMHYLHPSIEDFSDLLVDLCEYVSPRLTLVDAVDCMDGNGPTQGRPRHMGALIAADTAFHADLLCAHLIGLEAKDAPTVRAAIDRGLCPDRWDKLEICGDVTPFYLPDFEKLPPRNDIKLLSGTLIGTLAELVFASRPQVHPSRCVGCGRCHEACPTGAAKVVDGKAQIRRKDCIRCFCCQELCPRGAITVHRTALARLLGK
jgi:uncharacterized protein (DUF362 family)/NAD-dependent dihydropyrimidine dehydrogenase PreA subunit